MPAAGGDARVVAIFGPTGIGKTAVAVALAELLEQAGHRAVAISADALQVYRGLETLTGAPGTADRARLEHRLVGVVSVTDTFSVAEFMPLAHGEIARALAGGLRPIVVGGTGLYLRAALTELDLAPPPQPGVRERLEAEVERRGAPALHAELAARAPEAAAAIEPGDRSRVIRALEASEDLPTTARGSAGRDQLWSGEPRHPTHLAGLVMERAALYERIDARVEAIVAQGAREEVERAERAGASATARKALGYRELLDGDVQGMKRRTRNYAKRQLTWMRKLAGVEVIDVTDRAPREVAEQVAMGAGWLQ